MHLAVASNEADISLHFGSAEVPESVSYVVVVRLEMRCTSSLCAQQLLSGLRSKLFEATSALDQLEEENFFSLTPIAKTTKIIHQCATSPEMGKTVYRLCLETCNLLGTILQVLITNHSTVNLRTTSSLYPDRYRSFAGVWVPATLSTISNY